MVRDIWSQAERVRDDCRGILSVTRAMCARRSWSRTRGSQDKCVAGDGPESTAGHHPGLLAVARKASRRPVGRDRCDDHELDDGVGDGCNRGRCAMSDDVGGWLRSWWTQRQHRVVKRDGGRLVALERTTHRRSRSVSSRRLIADGRRRANGRGLKSATAAQFVGDVAVPRRRQRGRDHSEDATAHSREVRSETRRTPRRLLRPLAVLLGHQASRQQCCGPSHLHRLRRLHRAASVV